MTIKINNYILRVIWTQHRTEQCLTGRFRVGHNCFTCKSMNHWSVIYGKLCYKLMWRKYRQTNMFKVRVFKVSIHVGSEKSKTKLDILVLEVCKMFVTWTYNPRHKSWNTCVIFPSPMLIWVCSHFNTPKYTRFNIGEGERHIWVRTKVWRVNVRNLEKIQDKCLLFQRFVTSIVV